MEPLVSIIIPLYNVENYIGKCLPTVLSQTYTNIEVLLVDDGSTDNSYRICKDFEASDNRIHVIHQSNAGVSSARNTGIEKARGEYIAFVDADDIIAPAYIQKMVESLGDSVLVICAYENITSYEHSFENTGGRRKKLSAEKCALKLLQGDFPVSTCTAIFLRDLVGDIRFPVGIRNNEDKEFLYHYLLDNESGTVAISNQKLYGYFVRKDSATHLKWNGSRDMIIVADRMQQLTMKKHPEWQQDAINSSIRARLNTLKWIIQSANSHDMKAEMAIIRKEVLNFGYPKKAGTRTKVEYAALKCGMKVYKLLFLLYRLLYSEEARERKNARIMISETSSS